MTAQPDPRIPENFWKLSESKLKTEEWDIRVGSSNNEIVAIRANDYHPKVLELSIDDIKKLVEPLGYQITKLDTSQE